MKKNQNKIGGVSNNTPSSTAIRSPQSNQNIDQRPPNNPRKKNNATDDSSQTTPRGGNKARNSKSNNPRVAVEEKDICSLESPEPKIAIDTRSLLENQPNINVGTIGHVTHGKSTLVEAMSTVKTAKFDSELERNMTIRLGYANAKIWKCPCCPVPSCYSSSSSKEKPGQMSCSHCLGILELVRHISFVDCPGHDVLMATMLNGAAVMDAALLLVAANEPCPQPQTREHLAATELMGLKDFAIIQNKVDLVTRQKATTSFEAIKNFTSGKESRKVPIIPVSAQRRLNLDIVCQYLANIPIPQRDLDSPALMIVVRSFDINKPGSEVSDLKGGVAGGTLVRGILRVGQLIEIRPGISYLENGIKKCRPIRTTITSMSSESNKLQIAIPGGLIGVATTVDPSLAKGDRMVGQLIGIPGHMPEVYERVVIHYSVMKRVVGISDNDHEKESVRPLKVSEQLKVNIGSATTNATVKHSEKSKATLALEFPCCTDLLEKISISRKVRGHWRLIGFGKIVDESVPIKLEEPLSRKK